MCAVTMWRCLSAAACCPLAPSWLSLLSEAGQGAGGLQCPQPVGCTAVHMTHCQPVLWAVVSALLLNFRLMHDILVGRVGHVLHHVCCAEGPAVYQ